MNVCNIRRRGIIPAIVVVGLLVTGLSSVAWAWEPKLPSSVQGPSSWYVNGRGGRYVVPVIQGKLSGPTVGIVKTDSNCMPDDQGLSHCHNQIELPSGRTITIQNTHKMSDYRCLSPGERVTVRPNGSSSSSWVTVQTDPQRSR